MAAPAREAGGGVLMERVLGKLGRFGVVGIVVTAFNYLLYVTMISFGFHYLVPTTIGWFLGLVVAFVGNKYWTFGRRSRTSAREAGRFIFAYLLQLVFGSCTLLMMIDALGLDPNPAYFINLALTAGFSFLFLDRFVFPSPATTTAPSV
jgi:putative flippase GtrA